MDERDPFRCLRVAMTGCTKGTCPPDPVSESAGARPSRDGREFATLRPSSIWRGPGRAWSRTRVRVGGHPLDAIVEGTNGLRFHVDAHGTPDRALRPQAGMRRQDTMLKFGYKALYLHLQFQARVPRLCSSLPTCHRHTFQAPGSCESWAPPTRSGTPSP